MSSLGTITQRSPLSALRPVLLLCVNCRPLDTGTSLPQAEGGAMPWAEGSDCIQEKASWTLKFTICFLTGKATGPAAVNSTVPFPAHVDLVTWAIRGFCLVTAARASHERLTVPIQSHHSLLVSMSSWFSFGGCLCPEVQPFLLGSPIYSLKLPVIAPVVPFTLWC